MNVGTLEGVLKLRDEMSTVLQRVTPLIAEVQKEFNKVAPAAEKAQSAMTGAASAAKAMGTSVAAANTTAANSFRQFNQAAQAMINTVAPAASRAVYALQQIPPALTQFSPAMKQVLGIGTALTVGIAVPLGLIAKRVGETAAEFEKQMTRIETLVGVSREEVSKWKDSVRDMVQAVGIGPAKLAEGLYFVTGAGIRTAKALDILKQSAQASAIGLGEVSTIARTVVGAVQAWEKSGLSSASATETLVATVREGNLAADEVASTFGRVMSIAATMGVTFQEVGAFVATFSRQGVRAAEAVTSLRGILSLLMKESRGSGKALEEVGLSTEKLRDVIRTEGLQKALMLLYTTFEQAGRLEDLGKAVPNVRALAGFLATAGTNGEAYVDVLRRMNAYQGQLGTTFARVQETAAYQWGLLSATVSALSERIGSSLLPGLNMIANALTGMVGAVVDAVNWFQQLPGPIGAFAKIAVGTLAASGPIVLGLAAIAKALQLVILGFTYLKTTQFAANIISQLAAIRIAATAITATTFTTTGGIFGYITGLGLAIPGVAKLVEGLMYGIVIATNAAVRSAALAQLVGWFTKLGGVVRIVAGYIPGLTRLFMLLRNPIVAIGMAIGVLTYGFLRWAGALDAAKGAVSGLFNWIMALGENAFLKLKLKVAEAKAEVRGWIEVLLEANPALRDANTLYQVYGDTLKGNVQEALAKLHGSLDASTDSLNKQNAELEKTIDLYNRLGQSMGPATKTPPALAIPEPIEVGGPSAKMSELIGSWEGDMRQLAIAIQRTFAQMLGAGEQISRFDWAFYEAVKGSENVHRLGAAFAAAKQELEDWKDESGAAEVQRLTEDIRNMEVMGTTVADLTTEYHLGAAAINLFKKQLNETDKAADRAGKKFQKLNDAFTGADAIETATQMLRAFAESGLKLSQLPIESLKKFGDAVQEVVENQRRQTGTAEDKWVGLRDAIAYTRVEAELFNKTIDPITGKLTMTAEDMRAYMEKWADRMVAAVTAFGEAKSALQDVAISKSISPEAVPIAEWARTQQQALDDLIASGQTQGEMWDTVHRSGREALIAIIAQIDPAVWGLQSMEQVLAQIQRLLPKIDLSKLGIDKNLIDTINAMTAGPPQAAAGPGIVEGYRKVFADLPDQLASSLREAFANKGNFKDAVNAIFASLAAQLNQVTYQKWFSGVFDKFATWLSHAFGDRVGTALRTSMKEVVGTMAAIVSSLFSSMMSPATQAINALVLSMSTALAKSAKDLGDQIAKMTGDAAAKSAAEARKSGMVVGGIFLAGMSAALTGYAATAGLQSKVKGVLAGAAAGAMAGMPFAAVTGGWSIAIGAAIGGIAALFGDAQKKADEMRQSFVDSLGGWDDLNEMAEAATYTGGHYALSQLLVADSTEKVAEAIRKLKEAYEKAKEKVAEFTKTSKVLVEQNGLMTKALFVQFAQLGKLGDEVKLDFLKQMTDKVASGFNKIAENMLAAFPADILAPFTEALSGLGDAAGEVVKKFYLITSIGTTGWQEITESVGGTSAAFGDLAKTLADGIKAGKPFGEVIADIAKAGKGTLKDLEAALIAAGRSPEAVSNLLTKIGDRLKTIGPLAGAAFGAMLSNGKSVVEALAALEPGLSSIETTLKASGLQAEGFLGEMMGWRGIVSANKDMFTMLSGVDDMLVGLHNSALLTQDSFGSLATLVGDAFDTLQSQGVSADEALRLMAPQLQKLWELSTDFGYSVDETTQAMLEQAKASGLVGDEFRSSQDKMVRALETMTDRLTQIVRLLGGTIPDAAEQAARGIDAAFSKPYTIRYSFSGPDDIPEFPTDPRTPAYASGTKGFVDFGRETAVRLHGREAVFTPSTLESLLTQVAAQSGSVAVSRGIATGGGSNQPVYIEVPVTLDGYEIARVVATKLPQVLRQRGVV